MKRLLSIVAVVAILVATTATCVYAQRLQQPLGRGVVAVRNGSSVLVSWRRLAQEPEGATYNVYVNGTKVNTNPLKNTNFQTTSSKVPTGASVTVTIIIDGVESEPSVPFVAKNFDMRNMFMSITFDASPLTASQFNTSYVWPVDLDGDGEMDYVVNRKSNSNALDCYVEGYLRTGEHLWTVKLGPNELSCSGQDDQITVADMDCDGFGDVIIQSSDGTQFWDPDKKDFGLYVNGSTKADTDNDGIVDYETQNTRNAPRYISIIDGLTGREKASIEQSYNQHYNRTNRASLMGDEYNKHVGHMGAFYPDGVHPAIVMEWHMRGIEGDHHYYNLGVAYDFTGGKAGKLRELFNEPTGAPAFHQIRIGDVDGDGCDEMMVGGYTMDNTGKVLFNTGIAHGDRFRISDIDPERPGLETFAVQQYAGDQLGMILYDSRTGESIKRWYMAATGDVGRGECMDVDPSHLGWEMWSTMDGNMYDAKGNLISGLANQYPCEGIWWDAEPDREVVQTSDSHYNVYIQDFYKGREVEFAKISNWRYITVYAKRAAFWGDIIGDWREELILLHKEGNVQVGIVGVSTDYTTSINNIYCLQEDPHYRGDCTTKGYYQSPNPGFYLGYDMPRPQLPPTMLTDLVFAPIFGSTSARSATFAPGNNAFTDYTRSENVSYADGKSVLFDLYSPSHIILNQSVRPSVIYAMPVRNQRLFVDGDGSFEGSMDLWKSQQGTFAINVPMNFTGTTYISEGTLEVNTTVQGPIELRARGTLAGNAILAENIVFEGALNYEGCRLSPGNESDPLGTITFKKGLTINRPIYYEANIENKNDAGAFEEQHADLLSIDGDLSVTSKLIINVKHTERLEPAEHIIITFSGEFKGKTDNIQVIGLEGLSYNINVGEGYVSIIINEQRQAAEGVVWTGAENTLWDYQTSNWQLGIGATEFVAGDQIIFNDAAQRTTVQADELMPIGGVLFENQTKTITIGGSGGFSGEGGITVNGNGRVNLRAKGSTYTGATIINSGSVEVAELADGGLPSSIGSSTTAAKNFQIGKARLIINNNNTATNRNVTLNDTASIQLASGIAAIKGRVSGKGTLRKEGAGQLNLTYGGANTYSGGTILAGGTLAMGTWNTTFGTATSPITVTGNSTIGIFNNNSTSQVPTFQNRLMIETGKTLTMATGQRCKIGGSLLGSGTMNISFPYVRGDFYMNCSNFEGTLNVSSGQFRITADTDLSKASVKLGSGVYAVHTKSQSATETNLTTRIGSLQSAATDATLSTGTWNVGYLNNDDSFAGKFTGSLNKYGTGTLVLTGSESTGALTIYAGLLSVSKGTTIGTFKHAGALSVRKGGALGIRVRRNASAVQCDAFEVAGNVTLFSPVLKVSLLGSRELEAGDELKVFTGAGTVSVSGAVSVEPAMPAPGLTWDSSRLATDGVLVVVASPDGISAVSADDDPTLQFDIAGRPLQSKLQRGLHITQGKKFVVK
ncbi:MAG: autotransporter-associated beta strand repeat-containing protein [Bacteroidaceae bacterium]|nr:autotransporter-associated beta strand repeat-containing protein [Bacteroidaceae bacterium]